jgi:hypothetical protein
VCFCGFSPVFSNFAPHMVVESAIINNNAPCPIWLIALPISSLRQVRSLKVVIGDPIALPVVNATNRIVRLFDGTIVENHSRIADLCAVSDPRRLSYVFEGFRPAKGCRYVRALKCSLITVPLVVLMQCKTAAFWTCVPSI